MLRLLVAAILLAVLVPPLVRARDVDGRYAQHDPRVREWFRSQVSPKTNISCCNEADGEQVEEDIRVGEYWIRSAMTQGEWLRVPADVVITQPNLWGRPVAWFRHDPSGRVTVYCYAPGPLL